MKELAQRREDIKYISFSRNFGKEAAMYAGLENSSGEYVIVMDADLQHPPQMIPRMVHGIEEGHDCCAARRISRQGESKVRSFFPEPSISSAIKLQTLKCRMARLISG